MVHLNLHKRLLIKRNGHDPFIDYLKGLCIIFVIINHCMPTVIMTYTAFFLWGASAVPIFLLIQVFHSYKKAHQPQNINYKRIWHKILAPYLLCELIIFLSFIIKTSHFQLPEIRDIFISMIKSGGYGPGAYYPWIYVQFAIIIPILRPVFKLRDPYCCIIFILISQAAETACSYYGMPQLGYRLSFIRYIFLFYLGFLLASYRVKLNRNSCIIAIFFLTISAYIVYAEPNLSPLLYTFVNPVCHWFCYIYIVYLLLFLLKHIYQLTPENIIKKTLLKTGKYSYEIFIFQMFYFCIIDDSLFDLIGTYIQNYYLLSFLKMLIPLIICTTPILIYKRIRELNYHNESNS